MIVQSLAHALGREHSEIDAEIEAFTSAFARCGYRLEPLLRALRALRRHIYMEEKFLFPPARAAGLDVAVLVMHREHVDIWHLLDQLAPSLAAGDHGSTVQEAYRKLMTLLVVHNHREEQALYRRIDALLDAEESRRLMEFLISGHMPVGWTVHGKEG